MNKSQKSQFDDIVLWIGKPLFKPYLVKHIFSYKSSVKIIMIGLTPLFISSLWDSTRINWNNILPFICVVCFAITIQVLLKIIGFRNTKYWITNDAVYIQTGIIRRTVNSIKKEKIIHIDVEKSSIEEKNNAGTVIIDDGEVKKRELNEYRVYKNLIAIKNPEEVLRLL